MITMPALLERTVDMVRESFGQPVRLRRLLLQHAEIRVNPDATPTSIAMSDVPRWNELDSVFRLDRKAVGSLLGWKLHGGHYSSFSLIRPEFLSFGHISIDESFTCDIASVQGLSAAKSDLCKYESMDQWIETESPELITPLSPTQLANNLAHRQIRVGRGDGSDYFCRFAWDGRLFLVNNGGAHHFGAARYLSRRVGMPVELRAPLHVRSISRFAIEGLRKDFEIFMLPDTPGIANEFHDAMGSMGVTWLWHRLPSPFNDCKAVYLPRSEARSMLVADVLRTNGAADLGRHWSMLLHRQSQHLS